MGSHVSGHAAHHLACYASARNGSGGLFENRHASDGRRNGAYPHEARRCEGGANVHHGGGVESHDGAGCHGDVELSGCGGVEWYDFHQIFHSIRAAARVVRGLEHVAARVDVLHASGHLNDLSDGDDAKGLMSVG